jgi:D-alanyl-D-alanine carboxypeptidase/D-alanyl-D-alanine-endopeptidase (penicillin-binding protein 4)
MPAVLLVTMLVSGALALGRPGGPGQHPEAAAATAPLGAPLLSPRRVPALLSGLVSRARLVAALDAALADPSLGPARARSCLVVHDRGQVLYERRPDEQLIPASTLKVLTGLAVLERLGPAARFVTEVKASTPAVAGVVAGRLWLVGSGDPLLATADYAASFRNQPQLFTPLEALADALVATGIREVTGGVAGDDSRYDDVRYVPTWKSGYITHSEIGPASGLVVNDGFVQFSPRKLATGAPARHAAEVLTTLLRARGVVVAGEPGVEVAPADAVVLGSVPSAPMAEVVAQMLRESDNLTSELLVKELGRRFGGGGSWAEGLAVLRATLLGAGLAVDGLTAVDGSGLDRSDRATCRLLTAATARAGPGSDLVTGFPVAARTGTLAERFVNSPLAGKLRAKTGSLDGVVGLVGYVESAAGGSVLFSLLANELPRDALGRALQEKVGIILTAYPDAPSPEELAPSVPPR